MNIKIDYDKIKNAICCEDLYKILDITKYFETKMITDISQIQMHPATGQKIFGIFMDNAIKGKDKRIKKYFLKERRSMVSFDWLGHAPTETMNCPKDFIRLVLEDELPI